MFGGEPRKALATETGLSERHLANLESGLGNASVLVLRQIANTLNCPLAEVIGDETTASAEWLLIRELLHGRDQVSVGESRPRDAGNHWYAERLYGALRSDLVAHGPDSTDRRADERDPYRRQCCRENRVLR